MYELTSPPIPNYTNKTKPYQTRPYQTILIHTKPYHKSSLYLQLSITAISIHNATQLSSHFRKIATVSHFRLVFLKIIDIFRILMKSRFQNWPWSLNLMKNWQKYRKLRKGFISEKSGNAEELKKNNECIDTFFNYTDLSSVFTCF